MNSQRTGLRVASFLFAIFAIGHLVRLIKNVQVTVGTHPIPMGVGWIALHRCRHSLYLAVATLIDIGTQSAFLHHSPAPPEPWRRQVIFQANPLAQLHRIDPTQRLMRSQVV